MAKKARKAKSTPVKLGKTESAAAVVPAQGASAPAMPAPIPVQAPTFYGSSVHIQGVNNDFNLVFQRAVPASQGARAISPSLAIQQPVVIVQMSAATLKDLSLLLPGVVKNYEKEYGEVKTAFMKRREKEKQAAAKPVSARRH